MSAFNILGGLLGQNGGGLGSILGKVLNQDQGSQGGQGSISDILGKLQTQGSDMFGRAQSQGSDILGKIQEATSGDNAVISSRDKTTLGAGALAILLGSKTDSSLAKLGGLAALGTVAYKAFQRWQEQQGTAADSSLGNPSVGSLPPSNGPAVDPQVPAEVEQVSQALLVAMITAAKADGHIQEEEKAQLDANLARLTDPQDRAWFQEEINRPVDPAYVASLATDPHIAAQMYALSLAMCNEQNFMEKAYLDELAKRLNLDPSLKAELESEVKNV